MPLLTVGFGLDIRYAIGASIGAESDLKQATSLARRMVGVWGMSPEVGPVSYGLGETHPFLGRELAAPREYAEATAGELDRAVRSLIDRGYARAREVVETHRAALDAIADLLLAQETVSGAQLDALLGPGAGSVVKGAG